MVSIARPSTFDILNVIVDFCTKFQKCFFGEGGVEISNNYLYTYIIYMLYMYFGKVETSKDCLSIYIYY